MESLEKRTLGFFLPKGVLEWFDIVESHADENEIKITLEEKNNPPEQPDKAIPKGFTEITITDFPIRGRRTLITFKRRYWSIEGRSKYLKRDIQLAFPGTQLEKEFAIFLKEDSRTGASFAHVYRKAVMPPTP